MHLPQIVRAITSLTLFVTIPACASMNPAGMIAASRLDPLNTPPSEIAVAVGVPKALRLSDGDARLRMSFQGGTASSAVILEEAADLRIAQADSAGPRANSPDETVYTATIAPEDARRIAGIQNEIRTSRATGIEGQGALSIEVVGGCYAGTAPESIPVSTWIRTGPSNSFIPLTRRQNILRAFGARDAALLRKALVECAE